jgi:hypothetical protein
MRRILLVIVITLLAAVAGVQTYQKDVIAARADSLNTLLDSSWITHTPEGEYFDVRGYHSSANFGQFMYERDTSSNLSMVVLLAAAQECWPCLTEIERLKEIDSVYNSRGQRVFVLTSTVDSAAIAELLEERKWDVEVVPIFGLESGLGMNFYKMGISAGATPFKIIFDSTMTAIYMRGANITPESQEVFQNAALNLSELAMAGKL